MYNYMHIHIYNLYIHKYIKYVMLLPNSDVDWDLVIAN